MSPIDEISSYRQGMHEILAPIIFVMHCDHQALLHINDISANDVESVEKFSHFSRIQLNNLNLNSFFHRIGLKEVLDPKYLEADS